jgi:hypothetical protein
MKTKKQVLKENPSKSKVINAVIDRVGMDRVDDVNRHGIDGGFNGFIYYVETHDFAMKHRKEIIEMLADDAESMGEEIVEMVSNFGYWRNTAKMDGDDKMELYKYIGGGRCEQSTITNLMAWYAAETVCQLFDE